MRSPSASFLENSDVFTKAKKCFQAGFTRLGAEDSIELQRIEGMLARTLDDLEGLRTM